MSARGVVVLCVAAVGVIDIAASPAPIIRRTVTLVDAIRVSQNQSQFLSDSAIAALIVQESRNAYYATGHPCACPDDLMRNGRRCGGNSAYIRPGGAHPLCSAGDVSPEMINRYRARSAR